jgi:hypothetical protein
LTHHRGLSTWAILLGALSTGIDFWVTRVHRAIGEVTGVRNLCVPLATDGDLEDDGESGWSQAVIILPALPHSGLDLRPSFSKRKSGASLTTNL